MTISGARRPVPAEFAAAMDELAAVRVRPEVVLSPTPAPQRIAPYSTALSAEVAPEGPDGDVVASGRIIVLHDPKGPEAWDGTWRIVSFATAQVEPDMGGDPLLGEVGWSWLCEALEGQEAPVWELGGTVTRVISQSFGSLDDKSDEVELEVRASWTIDGADAARHLVTWTELLCTLAGLPPLPDGVVGLPGIRR